MVMLPLAVLCLTLCASVAARTVGILYNVNFIQGAQAQATVKALGGEPLTTELVLRSNGRLTLSDVYAKYGLTSPSLLSAIYGVQPTLGFYCSYARRPLDPLPPPAPDCPNATGVFRAHAAALVAAGVDYIVMDLTNWPEFDNSTYDANGTTTRGSLLVDATVVRPFELLFETWAALRAEGLPTPRVAAWPCAPSPSRVAAPVAMWQYLLDAFYNNPAYSELIHTNAAGQKVFFMCPKPGTKGAQCFGNDTLALVESNGGRHDVAVTRMWAQMGEPEYAAGVWGFFSPCTANGSFTSSVVGAGPCAQFVTGGPGGAPAEVTAGTGWMLAPSGLPYAQPGHLRGLTLARQFEAVLATGAPDLLVSSFNEHQGGRVDWSGMPGPKIAFNMGLPADPQRDLVWVDAYAADFNRNLEPTVEGGGRVWEVLTACLALYRANRTCEGAANDDTCCTRADKEVFAAVWSLALGPDADRLLTASEAERNSFLAAGWREACATVSHPSTFCVDTADPDGRDGPFIVYNQAGVSQLGPTAPLTRCVDPASGAHSFTTSPGGCGPLGADDGVLGHVATVRGGEMLRALRRCRVAGGGGNASARLHALDLPCDSPDGDVLGYVR